MNSLRTIAIIGLASASLVSAEAVAPAFAAPAKPGVDSARLDATPADYTQYRRYHRGGGNRGAAIAAGVGLGILGAAAIAASRRANADPYYDDGYDDTPVYQAPPAYYAPPPRAYYRQPYDFRDHR